MKKLVILIGLIVASFSFTAYAQDEVAATTRGRGLRLMMTTNAAPATNDLISILPTQVNKKVARDFSKQCKAATDIKWYAYNNKGTVVYFELAGKKGRRFYDNKGNFVYNILSYDEHSLPQGVRELVKQTYYLDYSIDKVDEVLSDNKTVYFVNVSDSRTFKTIGIFEGEIYVLSDMIKSK